jgi:hypothetical protein
MRVSTASVPVLLALLFGLSSLAAPAPLVSQAPRADLEQKERRQQEFLQFDPHFKEERADRLAKARALGKQVYALEAAGKDTTCSQQILKDILWSYYSTADFKRIDQRLHDLEESLAHPEIGAGAADEQNPEDGSWGKCQTLWYFKLNATYDHFDKQENWNKPSKYPLRFLDRVNSPEKLADYFAAVSVSDIPHTGVDHLAEFNESLSDLMRLILRDKPNGYEWDPRLKKTLMDLLLHRLRNPDTGWWGPQYIRDGHTVFVDDLSMTFHTISYLHGDVPDWPKVLDTALAVKDLNFPVGWLYGGQYWNHHSMDAVVLFQFGWPYATDAQKKAIAIEIDKMIRWCLAESLQPDGTFKQHDGDGSLEESCYFGTAFLARAGFFDKSKRFWTDQEFPEAEKIRQRIIAYIKAHQTSGGSGGNYYESALEDLTDSK